MKGRLPAFAALVVLLASVPPAVAGEDCFSHALAAIDIVATPSNRLIVPLAVDGVEINAEIDTGTALSLMSPVLADRLKLRRGHAMRPLLAGADGAPLSDYVAGHGLRLGDYEAPSPLFVVPSGWQTVDPRVTVMLGANFLGATDLELDLGEGHVALVGPVSCRPDFAEWLPRPLAVPIEIADGRVMIKVTLDGRPLRALLDTGASHSSIGIGDAAQLFGLRADDPALEPAPPTLTTSGGRLPTWRYRTRSLAIGSMRFTDRVIDIIGRRDDPHQPRDHAMVLGLGELSQMHLLVSYSRRTLYVAAGD